jgi:hypothetical protein
MKTNLHPTKVHCPRCGKSRVAYWYELKQPLEKLCAICAKIVQHENVLRMRKIRHKIIKSFLICSADPLDGYKGGLITGTIYSGVEIMQWIHDDCVAIGAKFRDMATQQTYKVISSPNGYGLDFVEMEENNG